MIDTRLAPYGIFLLRVALGAMFIAHALLKYLVFTMPGFEGFLGKIGLPAALAWPIFLAELVGGAAIVAGFYGRWVSLALLPCSPARCSCTPATAGSSRQRAAAGSTRRFSRSRP